MSCKQQRVKRAAEHYSANGWTVITTPPGSLVDLITSKGSRLHFVKVTADLESAYSTGLAKNEYIQNAFSNVATPVFAVETSSNPPRYKFVNPNTDTRVQIKAAPAKPNTSLKK